MFIIVNAALNLSVSHTQRDIGRIGEEYGHNAGWLQDECEMDYGWMQE